MDFEARNHCTIEETQECPYTDRHKNAENGSACPAGGTIWGQNQGPTDRGQGINRTDRKIDSTCDNHDRHSNRHDREETGVLGNLDECRRIKELVDRHKGRNLLSRCICFESSRSFSIGSRFEFRQLN